jgi:hypothetical protein
MSESRSGIPPETLAVYEKLVATNPAVTRKGVTTPYTSLNGHMFSFITKAGKLALRLSTEERQNFQHKFNTQPVEQYGAVMKEYVEVPDDLFIQTADLEKYFALSYAYVASLKPKPTKRKKAARI